MSAVPVSMVACGALALALLSSAASADDEVLALQRMQFKNALRALEAGDLSRHERFLAALETYPLLDYLQYRGLELRLHDGERLDAAVAEFAARYPGRFAQQLHSTVLQRLVQSKDWRGVLLAVRPRRSDEERCLALRARAQLGGRLQWTAELRELWLRPSRLPGDCAEPFAALSASQPPDYKMVWERIELAMEAGDANSAQELGHWLNAADREWLALWIEAHHAPADALQAGVARGDVLLARRIVRHALRQLAREDAAAAHEAWSGLQGRFSYSGEQRAELERFIALRAAAQLEPRAFQWLGELPAGFRDRRVHAWQARAALRARDWQALSTALHEMPAAQRDDEQWQYWQARALQQLGESGAARELWAALATEATYYGFLAADRLAQPYRFNELPTEVDESALGALHANPHVVRAREFLLAGIEVEARREWRTAVAKLGPQQRVAAAVLADSWDWHDRAVHTIAGTPLRQAYALRFPMPFGELVSTASQRFSLEPSLIYGVMRRESAYRRDARSRAGALGLMQLMPATARRVARSLGTPLVRGELLRADVNIRFGAKYFRDMLDRFDQHQVLAAAAYNAGPRRVRRWLPADGALDADAWIDTLPFGETRGYVRAVLAYTTIFSWRRGEEVMRLSERMPKIVAPEVAAGAEPAPEGS